MGPSDTSKAGGQARAAAHPFPIRQSRARASGGNSISQGNISQGENTQSKTYVRTGVIGLIGVIWAAIVLTFLSWQLVEYQGLVSRLIEWQFARFDSSWPVVTLTVLTLLLTAPITLMLLYRMRKARSNPKLTTYEAALHRSQMMRRFLAWIAGGLALCAAAVAMLSLTIGGIREKPLPVSLADLRGGDTIEGLVVMDATL